MFSKIRCWAEMHTLSVGFEIPIIKIGRRTRNNFLLRSFSLSRFVAQINVCGKNRKGEQK